MSVVRLDDTRRWKIVSGNPIYDTEGNIIAGFVAFPDITEQVIAEKKLAVSEEKFRKIFSNVNISIWDEEGLYLETLLSKSEAFYDEVIKYKGRYIKDVLPSEKAKLFKETIQAALQTGEKQIVQYELNLPRGKLWFEG